MLLGMNRTSKSVAALYAYLRNVFRAPRLLVSWVPRYLAICVYTCLLLSLRQVASPRIRSATTDAYEGAFRMLFQTSTNVHPVNTLLVAVLPTCPWGGFDL